MSKNLKESVPHSWRSKIAIIETSSRVTWCAWSLWTIAISIIGVPRGHNSTLVDREPLQYLTFPEKNKVHRLEDLVMVPQAEKTKNLVVFPQKLKSILLRVPLLIPGSSWYKSKSQSKSKHKRKHLQALGCPPYKGYTAITEAKHSSKRVF